MAVTRRESGRGSNLKIRPYLGLSLRVKVIQLPGGGGGVCIDWIDLIQDRNWWRVLLNVVMNLPV